MTPLSAKKTTSSFGNGNGHFRSAIAGILSASIFVVAGADIMIVTELFIQPSSCTKLSVPEPTDQDQASFIPPTIVIATPLTIVEEI